MARKKSQKIIKELKKIHKATIILVLLFAVLGIGAGFGTAYFLTKNDVFELIGDSKIELIIGETYEEQGVRAVAFGKDISSTVEIKGTVNTQEKGRYVLEYTVNNFRFKDYVLYKLVIVKEQGE